VRAISPCRPGSTKDGSTHRSRADRKQLLVIELRALLPDRNLLPDDDLRADRVQEITQLDVELAFPDQEFLLGLMERMMGDVWRECLGVELEAPFQRMTFAEADRRFGSDKPDLRFGLEIEDATAVTRGSGFGVFAGADAVRFLRVPKIFSRAELTALEEFAKQWAPRVAYLIHASRRVRSPIA
jgi:aspartyl-tRNA synthetase